MATLKLKFSKPNTDFWTVLILVFATLITRLVYIEHYFVDFDSVGFALGSISYSLEFTRPHLPGYFLHVKIIALLKAILGDVHTAILTLSVIYSMLAAFFTYVLLRKWFGQIISVIISLLVITNPMVWYYGSVTDSYTFEWFFAVFIVYLMFNKKFVLFIPILIAAGAGIRQTTGLFLAVIFYLFFFWNKLYKNYKVSQLVIFHLIAVAVGLLWFIPMVNSTGSFGNYLKLYSNNSPLPKISIMQNVFQMSSYLVFVVVPYFFVVIEILYNWKKLKHIRLHIDPEIVRLILVWIIPPLIFFIFFVYSKGYFLLIIVPFYFILGLFLKDKLITPTPLIISIIVDVLLYLYFPYNVPSIESMKDPGIRSIKNYEVWYERTTSFFLMSKSRIEYNDSSVEDLSKIIETYLNKNQNGNLPYFFFDPSAASYARGLQYLFPRPKLVTMDQLSRDKYVLYSGLDVSEREGLRDVLKDCVIISRSDFTTKYLHGLYKDIIPSLRFELITPDSKYFEKIVDQYNFLFLRHKEGRL